MKHRFFLVTVSALALVACSSQTNSAGENASSNTQVSGEQSAHKEVLVADNAQFEEAVKDAQPGDVIVLANGEWRDFDAVFKGEGTKEAPITLRAETEGGVTLTGQSSLRLGGEYLEVSGLVFENGFTARNEVISFRVDEENLAHNSRVSKTVIKNYSNPDRTQRDTWVAMYGKNNEFDHNHLEGKLNSGPTMIIRLNTEESQENNHFVHHNYFGPRPVLGSNGGETFRIGTSHYSLTNSNSRVEHNYFDRCSGEVEIISNKSGGNTYRNNTFFSSRGTLTLRHGNGTTVENNLFDGNGAPFTGGVRVINARQSIKNNYFKDLTGERFSGGLVVMNGVPNSPINRYHQVDGAAIEGNVFENIVAIELGEGSDTERSAVPINSTFKNNVLLNEKEAPFTLHDDMSGIEFSGNKANQAPPEALSSGFEVSPGLTQEVDASKYGVAKEETGVSWFPKADAGDLFDTGADIVVSPGENAISDALKSAKAGDRLILEAGDYKESKIVDLKIPVTISAKDGVEVNLSFERKNMFVFSKDAALKLEGVSVTGKQAPDNVGNSFITTTSVEGARNHVLVIKKSSFKDFVVNRSFSIVSAAKGTLFKKIKIEDSSFSNISGSVVKLNGETDDYGMYNVETLKVSGSKFSDIQGPALNVYRGGRDESTFGPFVWVKDSEFVNAASSGGPSVLLHGVQVLKIEGNSIEKSEPFKFIITTGKPAPVVEGNSLNGDAAATVLTIEDLRK